ncbi:MAG: hypothetical protein PQJ44_01420 [Sphaerochaetaceae bacterium]|nr:hypothetical protein [Sphaerochaetaceae bacterium]
MNKHILDMLEKASFDEELKSNVSVRNFYYYCEKHKIKCELKGEDLFVKYKSKDIICTQDGDFRMGRAIIHMKKAK